MRRVKAPLCRHCAEMLKTAGLIITRLHETADVGSVCPWCERAGAFTIFHIEESREA